MADLSAFDGFRRALVLGGARSGKSALAQALTERAAPRRVYIATAEAGDAEMAERIERHRAERGAGWETMEAPLELADALAEADGPDRALLIDCATLWLSNLIFAGREVDDQTEMLLEALARLQAPVALVSNEIGLGLVPETSLGRAFRDAQGRLNQRLAAQADLALFVAAGLPLALKQART